jgi:dienelactone hydrolase
VGDAYAALAWLRVQPGVDLHRIAVMGWSHGGGVIEMILRSLYLKVIGVFVNYLI